MQLTLDRLIPKPLEEKIKATGSSVWNQQAGFEKGEYIFIQAPSGTGKTTLMHTLYGLRTDYNGSLQWGGRNFTDAKAAEIARLRSSHISIIFQDMRLFPELTAMENLEVKRGLTDTVTAQQVSLWMDRLGVGHKANSLASTLSYGEQQRVAIIRALVQPFDWLLMDEPFSHLDHANIMKAATLIAEVVKANSAGLIMADLEDNDFFSYNRKLIL